MSDRTMNSLEWYLGPNDTFIGASEHTYLERVENTLKGRRNVDDEFSALCATTVYGYERLSPSGRKRIETILNWYILVRRPSDADHMLIDGIVREYRMTLAMNLLPALLSSRWNARVQMVQSLIEFGGGAQELLAERRSLFKAMRKQARELMSTASVRRQRILASLIQVIDGQLS